jgi:hypothetical protein
VSPTPERGSELEPKKEKTVAKNEPLPPLSEVGPCRRGCGRELGKMPGPRARHENLCDGTPDAQPVAAERKPRTARVKARGRKAAPPADHGRNGSGLVEQMRERAQVLRTNAELMKKEAEKRLKAAERLEEMAQEVGSF